MRWLFIVLLLLNVIYFGWQIDSNARLVRLHAQPPIKIPLNTESLILLSELDSLPAEKPKAAKSPAGIISGEVYCYRYGPLSDINDVTLLSNWFDDRGIHYQSRRVFQAKESLFWLYLAPEESVQLAVAILQDLKQKGIEHAHLIEEGHFLNAISLGLFSNEAAVSEQLRLVQAAGYQPLLIKQDGDDGVEHWFDVRAVSNSSYFNDLLTGLPSRFDSLSIDCNTIAVHNDKL